MEIDRNYDEEPHADGVAPRSGSSEVLDPVFIRMLLGGGILIGAILAARVKQVGSIEFFEGCRTSCLM